MTLRKRLRQQTSNEHSSLERLPVSRSLVSSKLSLSLYMDILSAWYCWLQGVRPSLSAFPRFARSIEHDVASLHEDFLALEQRIPPIQSRSPMESDQALGFFYVILGSHLGSRLISRSLGRHANPRIRENIRFFTRDCACEWIEFTEFLETQDLSAEREQLVIAGAQSAFCEISSYYQAIDRKQIL